MTCFVRVVGIFCDPGIRVLRVVGGVTNCGRCSFVGGAV